MGSGLAGLPAGFGSHETDADSLSGMAAYRIAMRIICFAPCCISVASNLNALGGVQSLNSPIISCDSRCYSSGYVVQIECEFIETQTFEIGEEC